MVNYFCKIKFIYEEYLKVNCVSTFSGLTNNFISQQLSLRIPPVPVHSVIKMCGWAYLSVHIGRYQHLLNGLLLCGVRSVVLQTFPRSRLVDGMDRGLSSRILHLGGVPWSGRLPVSYGRHRLGADVLISRVNRLWDGVGHRTGHYQQG